MPSMGLADRPYGGNSRPLPAWMNAAMLGPSQGGAARPGVYGGQVPGFAWRPPPMADNPAGQNPLGNYMPRPAMPRPPAAMQGYGFPMADNPAGQNPFANYMQQQAPNPLMQYMQQGAGSPGWGAYMQQMFPGGRPGMMRPQGWQNSQFLNPMMGRPAPEGMW